MNAKNMLKIVKIWLISCSKISLVYKCFFSSKISTKSFIEFMIDLSEFEQFPHYFRQGHPVENLHALSRCDYLIGSPSTFLTWPSFIGKVPCFQLFPKDLDKNRIPFPLRVTPSSKQSSTDT